MAVRRSTRAVLAAAAATAGALSTLAVGQSPSQAADAAATGDTFALTGRGGQVKYIDEGRKGPSVGDRYVFSESLFEKGSSDRVGRLAAFCDVTYVKRNSKGKVTSALQQCISTFRLPPGQIAAQGSFDPLSGKGVLAITGGTGSYDQATGEIQLEMVDEDTTRYAFDVGDGGVLP